MEFKDYIKKVTQIKLAASLGISQAMVSKWYRGVPVAAEMVRPVSEVTNWQVTPHKLRPDLYPHPLDGLPEHLRVAA